MRSCLFFNFIWEKAFNVIATFCDLKKKSNTKLRLTAVSGGGGGGGGGGEPGKPTMVFLKWKKKKKELCN